MKLLVTGGAGFIGSNFIRYWLSNHPSDVVINFDLLTYAGNLANLSDIADLPNYHFIQGDIRDRQAVDRAMSGVDVVVHFAAESHVDRSITEPDAFITTNVLGTQVLLEAALKAGVKRFHHISTDEVFGSLELNDGKKFKEDFPYRPNSPYSASKAAADGLVRAYYSTYGLPITITNSSNNYGPYLFPEKFIANLITRALTGRKLPVYGEGKNVRDWLYVVDHCRAIEAVIERGQVGETYLVGGGNEMPNIEVAKIVCRETGLSENLIEFVKDRPGHDLRYAIDCAKIQTELGWQPIYTFETGLRSTIEWYKKNRSWWEPLLDRAKIKSNGSAVMDYNWGLPQEELANTMNTEPDIHINGEDREIAKTKTVLIFGRGQLGTFYKDYYQQKGYKVVQSVRPEVDVRNFESVKRVVESVRPDIVINCAAMTNIDWCEQNKLEAFDINTLGADNIARACQETSTSLVHISSGCVQESLTPDDVKTEDDPVAPLCYYSWTKVWAENLIMDRMQKNRLWALILRPRQLLSGMVSPRNALAKMLTYTKFVDTPNSCTVVEDLLVVTDELVERNVGGLYNVVNPGVTSPYRIALMLKEIVKPDMQFVKISKDELNKMTLAKRVDAVLNTDKLNSLGITLPPLHQRLPDIMRNLKVNLESGEAEQVMAKVLQETQAKLSLLK